MTVDEMRAILGLDDSYTDDQVVALYAEYLEGQQTPSASELLSSFRARFPELAVVTDAVVTYWIDDAAKWASKHTFGDDAEIAQLLYAAHNIAVGQNYLPDGVTQMKSGTLSLSFTGNANDGTVTSTRYGRQYAALLRLHNGGPRVTSGGAVPFCGYRRTSLLGG